MARIVCSGNTGECVDNIDTKNRSLYASPTRLGRFYHWGGSSDYELDSPSRSQHLFCVGQTGTGKSSALLNLAVQDMQAGDGVMVLDPHGDLADDLMERVPSWRSNDVMVFDPSDPDHAPSFNWLAGADSSESRALRVSGIVSAMRAVWSDSWGPRLERLLNASLLALAEADNTSLACVAKLLLDERYRRRILRQVSDPFVRQFWEGEYASYDRRFINEAASPLLNKLDAVLLSPALRSVFGQVGSKIDFRQAMDRGRIVIARLPKGRLGEDKTALAGSLLLSAVWDAALSRVDGPAGERRAFNVYVDELAVFRNDRLGPMLSEARKLNLRLSLFAQHLGQLDEAVVAAVFGNVGTVASFRVGELDAHLLARHLGDEVSATQLVDLPNHHCVVRTIRAGRRELPVVVQTDPPPRPASSRPRAALLVDLSRRRYSTPRRIVEERLRRWAAH